MRHIHKRKVTNTPTCRIVLLHSHQGPSRQRAGKIPHTSMDRVQFRVTTCPHKTRKTLVCVWSGHWFSVTVLWLCICRIWLFISGIDQTSCSGSTSQQRCVWPLKPYPDRPEEANQTACFPSGEATNQVIRRFCFSAETCNNLFTQLDEGDITDPVVTLSLFWPGEALWLFKELNKKQNQC